MCACTDSVLGGGIIIVTISLQWLLAQHTMFSTQGQTKGTFTHARSGRGRRRGENLLQHKSLHTFTHTRSQSGSKIRSATDGSNTQFSASASKPRASTHLCPQEMTEPPASTTCMCEHTRGGGAGMSKSARLHSATDPCMCERSFRMYWKGARCPCSS